MNAQPSAVNGAIIYYTIFPDRFAHEKHELAETWPEIVERIKFPARVAPEKHALPLLSFGLYGNVRTEKKALRHADNLIAITGVEGDYDQKKVPMEDAAERMGLAGIRCLFYTTPTHAPDAPKWRIIAPLSREYPPRERAKFLARVNGILGGVLTGESFTVSQSFYFGRVAGVEYEVIAVEGDCIDTRPEFDQHAIMPKNKTTADGVTSDATTDTELREAIRTGTNFHESLRSLSARLIGRGMTAADASAVLHQFMEDSTERGSERWRERCAEIPRLVESAVAKFRDPREVTSNGSNLDPPPDRFPPMDVIAEDAAPEGNVEAPPAPPEGIVALTPVALDCLDVEPAPAEFIIPGYLPVELILRSAPGGIGKSTLVVQESISIVTGTPLFGLDTFTIEQPGPVVIVTAEDDEKRIKRRIHYIFKAMLATGDFRADGIIEAHDLKRIKARIADGIFIKDVSAQPARLVQLDLFSHAQNLVLSPFVDELVEQLKALDPRPVMVVLDPAIQFSAGSRFGQDGDALLVTACRRILREVGCAVLLIDHSGKQQAREKVSDQYARRGSTALPDGCRAIHVLNHVEAAEAAMLPAAIPRAAVEERRVLRLDVPKLTDGKPWAGSLLLVRDHWRFTAHWAPGKPDAEEARKQEQTRFYEAVEKVVRFVRLNPGIGYGEVRDRHKEIGIGRDQVAAARDHAVGKGQIEERKEAGKTRPLRCLYPVDSADSAR